MARRISSIRLATYLFENHHDRVPKLFRCLVNLLVFWFCNSFVNHLGVSVSRTLAFVTGFTFVSVDVDFESEVMSSTIWVSVFPGIIGGLSHLSSMVSGFLASSFCLIHYFFFFHLSSFVKDFFLSFLVFVDGDWEGVVHFLAYLNVKIFTFDNVVTSIHHIYLFWDLSESFCLHVVFGSTTPHAALPAN